MTKYLLFLAFCLVLTSKCVAQDDLLGKTREDILAFAHQFHYPLTDSVFSKASEIGVSEQIQIENVLKWHTQSRLSLLIDTAGRVAFESYMFFTPPTSGNSHYGMNHEGRVEALEELDRLYGKGELVSQRYGDVYQWVHHDTIYEFGGSDVPKGDCVCFFMGETTEFRRRIQLIPLSGVFNITDSTIIKRIDSAHVTLPPIPFSK